MNKRPTQIFFSLCMSMGLSGAIFAQTDSLVVDETGNVGVGIEAPTVPLHVFRSPDTATNLSLFLLENKGASRFDIINNNNNINWFFQNDQDGTFKFSKIGTGGAELVVSERDDNFAGKATLSVKGSVEATNVTFSSSRDLKTDFHEISTREVLDKLVSLPVTEWRYTTERDGTRHIGPVAEEFAAAFGYGRTGDDKHISMVDAYGVTMAAIQGLKEEHDAQIAKKDAEIAELEDRLAALEKLVLSQQEISMQ